MQMERIISRNYVLKSERELNGMYYFEKREIDNSDSYIVISPDHRIVEPATDYLFYCIQDENISRDKIKKSAQAIVHYYNFKRLFKLSVLNLTSVQLNTYIKYLSLIPKRLLNRIEIHPSELEYLPIHPYLFPDNNQVVRKIYKEWFKELLPVPGSNVVSAYDKENVRFEIDEMLWRYNYEYIERTVRLTLDFIDWASKSKKWRHLFSPIEEKTAKRELYYHKEAKKYFLVWNIGGRIKNYTKLERNQHQTIERKRIFFESELLAFFKTYYIDQNDQRKLFFVLQLLTGVRVSESLNLLLRKLRIEIPRTLVNKNPYDVKTIIKWEDLFEIQEGSNTFNDLVIDYLLDFKIRIKKRIKYESKRRKNKSKKTRYTTLKDYFGFSSILGLESKEFLIDPQKVEESFRRQCMLKKQDTYTLIKASMNYYLTQKQKGLDDIEDPRFDPSYREIIYKIRSLIEESEFGKLLRIYLIKRHLLFKKYGDDTSFNSHYLFVNFRVNKTSSIEPDTIRNWFKKCTDDGEIDRYLFYPLPILKHSLKPDLTPHSFRHTYISARIMYETELSIYNDASLKRDVGHVPNSQVTHTVYFFKDTERRKNAKLAIYKTLKEKVETILLPGVASKKQENEHEIT